MMIMQLVEEVVDLGPRTVRVLRPEQPEALVDDLAFEREEYLPYWAEVWPSARALGKEVARADLAGRRVVEIGCGLGIPSVAAALGGAEVLATDWSVDALVATARNAELNGVRVETCEVAWASPGMLVDRGPFDLILASDVIYERRNLDALIALLPRLGAEVWLADPGRRPAADFFTLAADDWAITPTVPEPDMPQVKVHRMHRRRA